MRQTLAAHLTLSRGVAAGPDNIVVVSGARQALHLSAHALLDPGELIVCENPGYADARTAFTLSGARVEPVPVDGDGRDVDTAERLAPHARAAYVTPSHQFPTGAVMGLSRRLRLLDWAGRNNAWILEDDYDSEFCYDRRPLPALQGLDDHGAVVYVGTLNKITFPGLRLGYIAAPAPVASAFVSIAATMSVSPPIAVQAAAADFISEGRLAQHIARAREVYRDRQQQLVSELDRHVGDRIRLEPVSVGMHILAKLRDTSAEEVARRGAARGLDIRTLSSYAFGRPATEQALILGYTHMTPEQIRSAVRELAGILCASG